MNSTVEKQSSNNDKIKLKFFALKNKYNMNNLYKIRNNLLENYKLRDHFSQEDIEFWNNKCENLHIKYMQFIETMRVIQSKDPDFNYNFNPT